MITFIDEDCNTIRQFSSTSIPCVGNEVYLADKKGEMERYVVKEVSFFYYEDRQDVLITLKIN